MLKTKCSRSQLLDSIKQIVKEQRSSKNIIIRHFVSVLYIFRNAYATLKHFCKSKDFRAIFLLKLLNPKNVHQTTSLTAFDRYPEIFSICKNYFDGKQNLKILSYGCSTGEEVMSLRKYFPTAFLFGAEINRNSLAICRNLPTDEKIKFLYSSQRELLINGHYDAIFCMAVLQRKPHLIAEQGITNLKKIYPFEKFEKQIIELDELIKPLGLLIVNNTQYSLLDTSIAYKYKALSNHNYKNYNMPVFDKNSILVKDQAPQDTIFIKLNN